MLKSMPRRFLIIMICLLLCVSSAVAAEKIKATLTPSTTVWDPGEEITFTGEVRHKGRELGGAKLKLVIETDQEADDKGEPLITSINGEELDSGWWDSELILLESEAKGDLLRFSGRWTAPDGARFGKAVLTLYVILEDKTVATASFETNNTHPVIELKGLTVPETAVILLAVIAVIAGLWFLLHRRKEKPGKIREDGKGGRVLDTVIILLFFLGVILTPIIIRVPLLHKAIRSIGYLRYLNFPCTLALLLSFLRLKKWTAADLIFFAVWLLLLIPMLISNRKLEDTRYVTVFVQNLLPVFFVFFRMNQQSRQRTIRLFMIVFNSFIFVLLVLAIEEKITGKAIFHGYIDWLLSQDMDAWNLVRFYDESRFFSFWGHPLTNALLFNFFLALNAVWYKARGKKAYALLYFPAAMAGVLLSGSKTGIVVCFLMLIVMCWEQKKWFLVCIPVIAVLYFSGAFNLIIYRFTHTSLTTGRLEALIKYFTKWYTQFPFQWLSGYSSNIVLDVTHKLYPVRAGFEFPLLMFALDYGIVFSVLLMVGLYGYVTWRCLRKRQWMIWIIYTLVFAEINTYNAFSLRSLDVFIIGNFMTMIMLNMLPDEARTIHQEQPAAVGVNP